MQYIYNRKWNLKEFSNHDTLNQKIQFSMSTYVPAETIIMAINTTKMGDIIHAKVKLNKEQQQ